MHTMSSWCRLLCITAVLLCIAVSDGIADHDSCTLQHLTSTIPQPAKDPPELQLLQVQSSLVNGKKRAARLSPIATHARLLTNISTEHKDDETDDQIRAAFLVKLINYGSRAKYATASGLVFGFNGMYCERRFGGLLNHHNHDGNHGPEILNTATAVFIVLVGIYQLVAWEHGSVFIRFLSAFVIVNGWSSALRHFADIPFCAVLDGTTMVIGASLGCCYIADLVTQRMENKLGIAAMRVVVWAGMPLLMILSFFQSAGAFDPHTTSSAFRFMFAFPLILVGIGVVGSLWLNWITWTSVDDDTLATLKWELKVGIPLCLLGAACLGISELFCDEGPLAQYFPGHALWHLLFPFGVNALLLYVCVLYADTKLLQVRFRSGEGWKSTWYAAAPSFTTCALGSWVDQNIKHKVSTTHTAFITKGF